MTTQRTTDAGKTMGDRPQRRIVCAALRAADGDVLVGIRHYSTDMRKQIQSRADGDKFNHLGEEDQGFVDQWGSYMTRAEAYMVADKVGQIMNHEACTPGRLYSEGLY
jgi:hypothetical protein